MPELPEAVSTYLTRLGLGEHRVVSLTGDASDRRYFRVSSADREPFVLAVYREPFEPAALPFVNTAALFAAMPVPVPRMLDTAGDLGILALEDLGDVTLQAHVGSATAEARAALYRQAVSLIEVFQRRGRALADDRYLAYHAAFDLEKLNWELDFFLTHFLESHRNIDLTSGERQALGEEFTVLADELASEPRVLCHRDYHSRNLMVRDGRLAIIDFQDARLGPDTYDLASLLRDAYVEIDEAAVDASITEFLSITDRRDEAEAFRSRFDRMTLQRTLKALGTFGYQATAADNPAYVPYIPRALGHVRGALQRTCDRRGRLTEILARHLPEIA